MFATEESPIAAAVCCVNFALNSASVPGRLQDPAKLRSLAIMITHGAEIPEISLGRPYHHAPSFVVSEPDFDQFLSAIQGLSFRRIKLYHLLVLPRGFLLSSVPPTEYSGEEQEDAILRVTAKKLAALVSGTTTMTAFAAKFTELEGIGAASTLALGLARNQSITRLSLTKNHLGDGGVVLTSKALISRGKNMLIELVIKRNHVSERGAGAVAELAASNSESLLRISVKKNHLGNRGVAILVRGLARCKAIRAMDLDLNEIGLAGASEVSKLLGGTLPSLRFLSLAGNELGDGGVRAMEERVAKDRTVTHLSLRGNDIGMLGAESIARFLTQNPVLTHLDLGWNNLGALGTRTIALAVIQGRTLVSLNLERNYLGNTGAILLCTAGILSGTASPLQVLSMASNSIGPSGGRAIAKSLQGNLRLERLSLAENLLGDAGTIFLAAALSQTALRELELSRNGVGESGVVAITKAMGVWRKVGIGGNFVSGTGILAVVSGAKSRGPNLLV